MTEQQDFVGKSCPKCGYIRNVTDVNIDSGKCPSCGVIYAKVLAAAVQNNTNRKKVLKYRSNQKRKRNFKLWFWIYLAVCIGLMAFSAHINNRFQEHAKDELVRIGASGFLIDYQKASEQIDKKTSPYSLPIASLSLLFGVLALLAKKEMTIQAFFVQRADDIEISPASRIVVYVVLSFAAVIFILFIFVTVSLSINDEVESEIEQKPAKIEEKPEIEMHPSTEVEVLRSMPQRIDDMERAYHKDTGQYTDDLVLLLRRYGQQAFRNQIRLVVASEWAMSGLVIIELTPGGYRVVIDPRLKRW